MPTSIPAQHMALTLTNFFVDTINDHGLEQLISVPTRGNNILDLILCSHPSLISNVEITPGISDHDAILYCFELPNKPLSYKIDHPIYLYHKGNMEGVKSDILDFQLQFLSSNPYSNDVESN